MIRHAAVAGSFYPGDRRALAAEVGAFLAAAAGGAGRPAPKAIIAPHAGYIYSGQVAARAFALLMPRRTSVTRVVLAGPAHRVFVRGAAVPEAEAFESPLGVVPVDRAAVERLRALPFVQASAHAHALEHSLEVHLPFLQTVLRDFSLVPVVVGDATPAEVSLLLETVWGGPETLIVVSSDLSHFHDYEAARVLDRDTAGEILRLNPVLDPGMACGAAPINGLLALARSRGLEPELVQICNSGDTAGGRERVVGYGAFAFHEGLHGRA
jgi:AmmeMemoRadiSam system protein B